MENQEFQTVSGSPDEIAAAFAEEVCKEIAKEPLAVEKHLRLLDDLKMNVARAGASLAEGDRLLPIAEKKELVWNIAQKLPDFDTQGLYQKRTSLQSLAASVLLGWFLGGIASALLNLIGMGGDILRVFAIFAAIWLNEYFVANPRARRIALSIFGLGALARFATMLAAGAVRFSGFSGFGRLVFGAARPNIFKAAWLMFGAFFLLIFFARKITAIDIVSFREELRTQIEQRLKLASFILKEIGERDKALLECRRGADADAGSPFCPKKTCQLAAGVLETLDSLSPDMRRFFRGKLAAVGFIPQSATEDADEFVWNSARDAALYNTVGLIHDGDRCLILKRPYQVDGKIVKGDAQRISVSPNEAGKEAINMGDGRSDVP